ncbi:MAG: glycosyltransferase family 2 protein [bacterium]|nr:glycosyltransferase family 2 protein [bacterium]
MQIIRKGAGYVKKHGLLRTLKKVRRHLLLRSLQNHQRPAPEKAHAAKTLRFIEKRQRQFSAVWDEQTARALIGTDDPVIWQDFFGTAHQPVPADRWIEQDARRDFLLRPMCWVMEESRWDERLHAAGHIRKTADEARALCWPSLGSCMVQVSFSDELPERIVPDAIRVLVSDHDAPGFDLCVRDDETAFDRIHIFCKARWLRLLAEAEDEPSCKATIVLCTYKRLDAAKAALEKMIAQDASDYEVLVVNNDPASREMPAIVQSFADERIRYIDCPYPGLSAARNFSLYEARGSILLYVDDDGLMEPDCLRLLIAAFDAHPDTDVIGGQILLKEPERFAHVILPGYEALWSQRSATHPEYYEALTDADFPYGCSYGIRRETARRMGGFRITYGRMGKDFAGGEEMVLSHLVKRDGGKVGIEPRAIIWHDVEPSRYTLEHVQKTMRASRLTNRLMKLDLYKPWDEGWREEKLLLEAAQDHLEELKREGVQPDDLRYPYCLYEVQASKEALSEGSKA